MDPTSSLGFGHFIAQSDALGQTLLALLLAMSVASWVLVAFKGLAQCDLAGCLFRRLDVNHSKRFVLDQVDQLLAGQFHQQLVARTLDRCIRRGLNVWLVPSRV